MDPHEKAIRQRLKDDFQHYAKKCLIINDKSGKSIPLELNSAQLHIHQQIQNQLFETGKVRVLVLKGRQQGCSTYAEGRLFWRTTHNKGTRAFILTHRVEATKNLYKMVLRYYDNYPKIMRPAVSTANANELEFGGLDSGYRIGTAGSRGVGRSDTIQYFHGSEVAYWMNGDEHVTGILQAVADVDGTEIILESTSNGPQGLFHKMYIDAEQGKNDYIAIFVPWFWQEEYWKTLPDQFELTDEEAHYKEIYNLLDEQMYWRRMKITNFIRGIKDFRREYPATAEEAFKAEHKQALWKPAQIKYLDEKYSLSEVMEQIDYVGIGFDPALEDKADSDAHGIVVAGLTGQGHGIVLDDLTVYGSPTEATKILIDAYTKYNANFIIYEKNVGGLWVKKLVEQMAGPLISIEGISVYQGKQIRAEPSQALYEQNLVKHRYPMLDLEDEMTTWIPNMGMRSPNRFDALVLCLTKVFATRYAAPVFG